MSVQALIDRLRQPLEQTSLLELIVFGTALVFVFVMLRARHRRRQRQRRRGRPLYQGRNRSGRYGRHVDDSGDVSHASAKEQDLHTEAFGEDFSDTADSDDDGD